MNRELIMRTLFARLEAAPLKFAFTANTVENDAQLYNVSDASGLFVGMPIFGDGIPADTLLETITPIVTLSRPAAKSAVDVALRQGFLTTGRRLRHWGKVDDQPALFLVGTEEDHFDSSPNEMTRPLLHAEIWIYAKSAEDDDAVPETVLNNLLDAVQSAITPAPGKARQDLGLSGVVYCRFQGQVVKESQGPQVLAQVPIVICVAAGIETAPLS
jgi:hypothetical protein